VEVAAGAELTQNRVVGLDPGLGVDLDPGAVTTLDLAFWARPQQGDALRRGRASPEVGDVGDVDTFGDHQVQDRFTQQSASDRDGDGSEPGDLTDLVALDRAA